MWTWTPDYPGMGGMTPPIRTSPTVADLLDGERYLKELRMKFEEEEKKKKEKKKPEAPKFSFMELWSFVMLFSIPVTIGQMAALQYVQSWLNHIAPLH